jgi:enoyl-CoA hydratase/carnithine racemase
LGEAFNAARANQLGLVTAVVPAPELLARASETAQKLARKPTGALTACKNLLKRSEREQLEQSVARETEEFAARVRSADAKEAISAFFEKRAPDFTRTKAGQPALKAS